MAECDASPLDDVSNADQQHRSVFIVGRLSERISAARDQCDAAGQLGDSQPVPSKWADKQLDNHQRRDRSGAKILPGDQMVCAVVAAFVIPPVETCPSSG